MIRVQLKKDDVAELVKQFGSNNVVVDKVDGDAVFCQVTEEQLTYAVGSERLEEILDALANIEEEVEDEFNLTIGSTAEDTMTGFIGVVTARTSYAHCEDMLLVETDENEKWITISRLKEI